MLAGADEEYSPEAAPTSGDAAAEGCISINIVNVVPIMWQDDKYYPMKHNT